MVVGKAPNKLQYFEKKPRQPQLVFMRVLYPGRIEICSRVGFCFIACMLLFLIINLPCFILLTRNENLEMLIIMPVHGLFWIVVPALELLINSFKWLTLILVG